MTNVFNEIETDIKEVANSLISGKTPKYSLFEIEQRYVKIVVESNKGKMPMNAKMRIAKEQVARDISYVMNKIN